MSNFRLIETIQIDRVNFRYIFQDEKLKVGDSVWDLRVDEKNNRLLISCNYLKMPILIRLSETMKHGTKLARQKFIMFDEKTLEQTVFYDDLINDHSFGTEISFFEEERVVTSHTEEDAKRKTLLPHLAAFIEDSNKIKECVAEFEHMSNGLNSIWQQKILTDVELKCGSKVFQAHKAVLAARSTYFAAMFQVPMKESRQNIVEIKNQDPHIIQIVLDYLYSGKKPEMNDFKMVCKVMMAADLYNLLGLRRSCSSFLRSTLSVSNAVSLLIFSDLYDSELKEDVVKFVCDHYDNLKRTEEWQNLQKQNPLLTIHVMSKKIDNL